MMATWIVMSLIAILMVLEVGLSGTAGQMFGK
jgi:hypothetical protein